MLVLAHRKDEHGRKKTHDTCGGPMKFRPTYVLTAVLLAIACGAAGDGPHAVADAFWSASKEGDVEIAKSYIAEGGNATIKDPDKSGSSVGEFLLDETTIDGERATVETTVETTGEQAMELAFQTVLVSRDGSWKVDLDETTDEMMKSLFGITMGELTKTMGQAMGDAMGEAMKGMAEGMAEGLKAATQTLADSLQGSGR